MPNLTLDNLKAVHDFEASRTLVAETIRRMSQDPDDMAAFIYRYTTWNGYFGSGVASLAGKVGSSRDIFIDNDFNVKPLADRSVLVASYFFDAARDEFDDRDTPHRDTHRCLAQAVVLGVFAYYKLSPKTVYRLTDHPIWLQGLIDRVQIGYGGSTPNDRATVFRSIGYHLGSEVLADQEFTLIDGHLRENYPELVKFLQEGSVTIAGQQHNSYQWLSIHSDYGEESGGVEAEHFEAAMKGARLALKYSPPELRDELRHQMILGFLDFAQDHREFFTHVDH